VSWIKKVNDIKMALPEGFPNSGPSKQRGLFFMGGCGEEGRLSNQIEINPKTGKTIFFNPALLILSKEEF